MIPNPYYTEKYERDARNKRNSWRAVSADASNDINGASMLSSTAKFLRRLFKGAK